MCGDRRPEQSRTSEFAGAWVGYGRGFGQRDRGGGLECGDFCGAQLPVPEPEAVERADRRGKYAVGPTAEILVPGIVPAVGVGWDRRRSELGAVEVDSRALGPEGEIDPIGGADLQIGAGDAARTLEEPQPRILAGMPATKPAVGQHLDREVADLATVACGQKDLLCGSASALIVEADRQRGEGMRRLRWREVSRSRRRRCRPRCRRRLGPSNRWSDPPRFRRWSSARRRDR